MVVHHLPFFTMETFTTIPAVPLVSAQFPPAFMLVN